jgi:hypothetical protein
VTRLPEIAVPRNILGKPQLKRLSAWLSFRGAQSANPESRHEILGSRLRRAPK